jgi:peroxiredoxin (alkyl hydroperoxide reductase subunit C)
MSCSTPKKVPQVTEENQENIINTNQKKEDIMSLAKVGTKAPDFSTTAYFNGDFMDFKLSNYLGSWVMLCFYPADFTFV